MIHMAKINFKKTVMFFIWTCLLIIIIQPMVVKADMDLWGEVDGTDYNEYLKTETGLPETDPRSVITNIIKLALSFLGIAAVIIILIGGFKWMTAGGNDEQIGDAKKWISSGVVGLLIILASYALANFILTQLQAVVT